MLGRSARSSLNTYPNVLTNNEFLAMQDSSIVDLISHSLMSLLILQWLNDYNDYQKEQIIVSCALCAHCNATVRVSFLLTLWD